LIDINKSTTLKNETDEIAYKYLSGLERNIYVGETSDAQDSPYQMFLNAISSLEESNNEANLGTSYSISGYNYFFIIKLVVYRIKKLDEDDVNKLLNLLIAIVLHDNQDPDAKVNAFQLLIYLSNNDIRFSHMNSQYKKIVDNDHSVLNVRDSFMFNHSSEVIRFNYLLFRSLYDHNVHFDYQFISDASNANTSERLEISKAIRNYLNGNKSEVNPLIIHILFILKSDENEQVRANSLIALLNFISHHKDENILIEISKMMDTETTLIKNIILKNISIIDEKNSEIAQYILQKGRIENHYLLRKQVLTAT